jgi:hypothetical protein
VSPSARQPRPLHLGDPAGWPSPRHTGTARYCTVPLASSGPRQGLVCPSTAAPARMHWLVGQIAHRARRPSPLVLPLLEAFATAGPRITACGPHAASADLARLEAWRPCHKTVTLFDALVWSGWLRKQITMPCSDRPRWRAWRARRATTNLAGEPLFCAHPALTAWPSFPSASTCPDYPDTAPSRRGTSPRHPNNNTALARDRPCQDLDYSYTSCLIAHALPPNCTPPS